MKRIWLSTLYLSLPVSARAMDYNISPKEKLVVVQAEGVLDDGDLFPIKLLLNQTMKKSPVVLELKMPGGSMDAAEKMAAMIEDAGAEHAKLHKRPLAILLSDQCLSACTLVTTILTDKAAKEEVRMYVPSGTVFGLHGPVLQKNGKWLDPVKNEGAYRYFVKKVIATYLKHGMDPVYARYLQSTEIKEIPAAELCQRQSMIVPPDACLDEGVGALERIANDGESAPGRINHAGSGLPFRGKPARISSSAAPSSRRFIA